MVRVLSDIDRFFSRINGPLAEFSGVVRGIHPDFWVARHTVSFLINKKLMMLGGFSEANREDAFKWPSIGRATVAVQQRSFFFPVYGALGYEAALEPLMEPSLGAIGPL